LKSAFAKKIEELFLEITDGIHLQNHQTKNILKTLSLLKRDENFFQEKSSEGVLKSIVEQKTCDEKRTPPSSTADAVESTSSSRGGITKLSLLDKREYPKGEGV